MTTIRPSDPTPATLTDAEQRAIEAAGSLARAGTALRHCLDEVHAADDAAWAAYSDASKTAIAHLQAELVLAGARLTTERAASHEEVEKATTMASHIAREVFDGLRVQVHLGRMDVTTAAEGALEDLEGLARDLRDGSRRLQHSATHGLEEARRAAGDAIHGARRALMVVAAAAREDMTFDGDGHRP